MKRQAQEQQLNRLADQIGGFIEYWGFKKIHGQIWTHLYLSPTPLSAQDLIARLKVSKALISLSMKDLVDYRLVIQTDESLERKNKFYYANPDVFDVIRNVLETRETHMLRRAAEEFAVLNTMCSEPVDPPLKGPAPTPIAELERLQSLGEMIHGAQTALKQLIELQKIQPNFLKITG
jgi:DNA-binding transcriptional regulator GbsR (MarR family)